MLMPTRRRPRGTRRLQHDFAVDTEVAADHRGRSYCQVCGLPGTPGDRNHPRRTFPPVPRAARELDARILGEANDD